MPHKMEGVIRLSTLTPLLEIQVSGPYQNFISCTAIVDTGFSGEIILSEHHINELGLKQIGTDDVELANGEIVELNLFRGNICWFEKVREVTIGSTQSEDALVGTMLLHQCTVHLDFPKSKVEITQSL